MPRTPELNGGQIQPVARPLGAFVQPGRLDAAGPARPPELPQGPQIGTIQRGGSTSIQPSYYQLAEALAPFSKSLGELMFKGAELYASSEYQKGQNEAVRAYALVNQQMQAGELEYAAENRRLFGKNPMAALAMDQANPYRVGGRLNQLSQLAGGEIESALMADYRANASQLAEIEVGDPRLNQRKASVIQALTDKFGITESTPGFVQYVLPKLNAGWDRVTDAHMKDRVAWLKDTVPGLLQAQLVRGAKSLNQQGYTSAQTAQQLTTIVDQQIRVMGIPGEAAPAKRKAITQALLGAMISGDTYLQEALGQILVGPPDANGIRTTAAEEYGVDLFYEGDKIAEIEWKKKQRGEEILKKGFENKAAQTLIGLEDGPEKAKAINELLADPEYEGLSAGVKMQVIGSMSKVTAEIDARGFDTDSANNWLLEQESLYGAAWNKAKFLEGLPAAVASLPESERTAFQARAISMMNRKDREKDDLPNAQINRSIEDRITANLKREYPTLQEAALRNVPPDQFNRILSSRNQDVAESVSRQRSAYQKLIYSRLQNATAQKGARLAPAEAQEVIDKALADYGKSDPRQNEYLFPNAVAPGQAPARPGTSSGSGGSGQQRQQAQRQAPPQVYTMSQLDNLPQEALRNYKERPLLDPASAVDAVGGVLNGEGFPKPLQRAARKAGVSPGRLLLEQLDRFNPGELKLTPAQRQKVLRTGQEQAAVSNYSSRIAAAPSPQAIAAQNASEWLMRIIAPPAAAAEMPIGTMSPLRLPRRSGGWPERGIGLPQPGGIPYVNQRASASGRGDRECFSASSAMVASAYLGRNVSLGEYNQARSRFGDSTSIDAQVQALRRMGVKATVNDNGSVDELTQLAGNGKPVAIGLNHNGASGHWIVVTGVTGNGDFIVNDPFGKLRQVRNGGWEKRNSGAAGDTTGRGVVYRREFLRSIFEDRGAGTGRIMRIQGSPMATATPTTRSGGGMTGLATYYTGRGGSDGVAGGPTANGERYNPEAMTAAVQWSLKPKYMNKWVIVEHLDTGKKVRVWVNDTGQMGGTERSVDQRQPRAIDLSPRAFQRLFGSTSAGVGRVRFYIDSSQRGRR